MRPPFAYYGSKVRLGPWIASLLPAHRMYVEPFCGSAAVLFAKPPSPHEVITDIDGNLVTFFRLLRDRPAELEHACRLTPYAREEYRLADLAEEDLGDMERARRFFVRCSQSFNGAGAGSAHSCAWSNGTRRNTSRAAGVRDAVDRFEQVADRLRAVIVENRGYDHTIPLYDRHDAAFYVDPPYLGSTRSSLDPELRRKSDYRHDLTSEQDHQVLAEVLHACEGTVLLSGYHSPLYDELYGDWWTTEVAVQRPAGNRKGHAAAKAIEVLWSNRPLEIQSSLDFETHDVAEDAA